MRLMRVAALVAVATLVSGAVVAGGAALASAWAGRWPGAREWRLAVVLLDGALLYATCAPRARWFGRVVDRGRRDRPLVAVTFDDGPNEPYTSRVLDILEAFDARATFFVLGARVEQWPHVVARMAAEGHEIGNHAWDHWPLAFAGPRSTARQIRRTSDRIQAITGVRPRLFRAPYGWRAPWTSWVARREGCATVAWTTGVYDTARPGADRIVERALRGLGNGCILLLHDGRSLDAAPDASQLVEALPTILRAAQERGYRLVTVSELMAASGEA
jgi:peptidoglycan/xylan/chitin deacetylase (PgdA/CDA1 family)